MSFDHSCYREPTVEDYSSQVSRDERDIPLGPFNRTSRRYSFSRPQKKSPPPIKTTSSASDSGYSSRSRATANSNDSTSPKSPFKTSPQSPATSKSSSSKNSGERTPGVPNATTDAKSKNGPPSSYKHKVKHQSGSRSPSKHPSPPAQSPQPTSTMYAPPYPPDYMPGRSQAPPSAYPQYSYTPTSNTPLATPSPAPYTPSGYPPTSQAIPVRRTQSRRPFSLELGSMPPPDYFSSHEQPPVTAIPHWGSYDDGNHYARYPRHDFRTERRPTLAHFPTESRSISRPRPNTMYEPYQALTRSRTVAAPRGEASRHRSKSKHRDGRNKSRKYKDEFDEFSDSDSRSTSDSEYDSDRPRRRDPQRKSSSAIPSRKSSRHPKSEKRSSRDEKQERKPRAPAKIINPEPTKHKSRPPEKKGEDDAQPSSSKALTKKDLTVARKSTNEESKNRDRLVKKKVDKTEQTAQEYQDRKAGRSTKKPTVIATDAPVVEAGVRPAKAIEAARPSPTVIQPMRPPQSTINNRRTSVDAPRAMTSVPKSDSAYDDGDGDDDNTLKFSVDARGQVHFRGDLGRSTLSTCPGQDGSIEYTISRNDREQKYFKTNSTRSSGSFRDRMSSLDAERYRSDRAMTSGRDQQPIEEES